MTRPSSRAVRLAFAILASLLAFSGLGSQARAQSFIWTSPSSGNWSIGTNWQGSVAPAAGGSDSTALIFTNTYPAGYTATNDLGNPFVLNGLTFAGRYGYGTSATQVTVASATNNSLRLVGASGASITLQTSANARVTSSLDLAAPTVTVAGPGSGNLFLTGSLTGAGQLVINRTGAAAAGQTILGGAANTFSGGVLLQSGALALDTITGLGTGPLTVAGPNTSLRFNTFVSGAIVANNISVPTAGNNFVYGGNNSAGFSGVISGAGGVSFAPSTSITLNLSGANTYTGPTAIIASNLRGHGARLGGTGHGEHE